LSKSILSKKQHFCILPWIHLHVAQNGKVSPCCNNNRFLGNVQENSIEEIWKGKKFEDYLELIKHPKWGRGVAMNPCKDCKIFIFQEGKRLAEELGAEVIVTGEVIGQRPMSQMKKTLLFDEEMAGLKGKILRPLSAKLLPETDYEKEGLVDRTKLYAIGGRRRMEQMKLAEKYGIKYPGSGGGCLLCDKAYSKKLKYLFDYKEKVLFEEILLLNRGRMFKNKGILIVGRGKEENIFIEKIANTIGWFIKKNDDVPGPTIIYDKKEDSELTEKLWEAYRGKDLKKRKEFENFVV